ncbi:regulator of G-protein signaling 7-like isoform X2 [Rhodnius prolixus]|uniref:regulator of G-protein signaling 7-like isoform X2 n=1 Tax=Rhodnius prolixus TaxID=13249 RepID=UPI003D189278
MEPRPFAFRKMEALVKQMQDPDTGVPVRSQKIFLTSIPSAFIGYDLIEWLMEHLNIDESGEAVHLANQLCQYGYLFPVTDCKTLTVKDDNSLYRFQAAYYWPWHHRNPDNVEYAIYLVKRTLRNKQRHALEDYEIDALNSLKRNLQNKWEIVMMQAEEQVKVGKERKKMDKLVADSQERAYWRVHRPPPGCQPPLEPSPITTLRRCINALPLTSQIEILKRQVSKSRVKLSQAIEGLVTYSNTYAEYDPLFTQPQPSNPWLSDDPSLWQFNQSIVEVPTEKRVKRWALSFEDLLADPTGVAEFTNYLRKEYSHENIRFWLAVKELRHCSHSQVPVKVNSIYQEFLAHGAPCEINIDSKTQETTLNEMKNPSRFTFDVAAHHVYNALLNKDCYPRFIRSDQYKCLLANALHPPIKKRFFGFGGGGKKKSCTGTVAAVASKRRGSDRSLSGVIHETSFTNQMDSSVSPERSTPTHKELKQKSVEQKQLSEDERHTGDISTQLEPGPSFFKTEPLFTKEIGEPTELILPVNNSCGNASTSEDMIKKLEEIDLRNKETKSSSNMEAIRLNEENVLSVVTSEDSNKIKEQIVEFTNPQITSVMREKIKNEECESPNPEQKLCTVLNKVLGISSENLVENKLLSLDSPNLKHICQVSENTEGAIDEKLRVDSPEERKEGSDLRSIDVSNECPDKTVDVPGGGGVPEDICTSGSQRRADICPWEDEFSSHAFLNSDKRLRQKQLSDLGS